MPSLRPSLGRTSLLKPKVRNLDTIVGKKLETRYGFFCEKLTCEGLHDAYKYGNAGS